MATSAPDISSLIEVASAPDPTPTTSAPPVDESSAAPVDTGVLEQGLEENEVPEEGAEKPPAQPNVDARKNPDAIRKALRQLRDSSPENAPIARELNNVVGRHNAYAEIFPKVDDARNAKVLLDAVGGSDGLTSLQSTIKSVNETDALLYAGDGKVLDSIYEDMKAAGKQDAFGKLAGPFLEKLAQNDPKAFTATVRPLVVDNLIKANFHGVLGSLEEALGARDAARNPAPDLNLIKALAGEMKRWFNEEKNAVEGLKKTTLDPDRQAFEKERSEFQSQKQKAFQSEVNGEWNRVNALELGGALKQYLKEPFAKNWTDATKQSVAREIMGNLMSELTADKSYQAQMDAFWSERQPDKSKIVSFHKSKLAAIKDRIVKDTLEARYPGFRAPRPAGQRPVAARPGAPGAQQAAAPGTKPIFQPNKPRMDDPNVDWDRSMEGTLYTRGIFYDKRGVLRTWNTRYR